MVVFRYSKVDGAEYLSHLDMLRHLNKIIRRAGINASYSKGYNPHMSIYMSSPIGVGVKSMAEYCLVECNDNAEDFKNNFNKVTFRGANCISAVNVNKKINVAGAINRALYEIKGINKFDVDKVLESETFEITDKKGNRKDVKHKIFNMYFENDNLMCVIGFGNEALRPDLFGRELASLFGGNVTSVLKKEVFVNDITFDEFIEGKNKEEVPQ